LFIYNKHTTNIAIKQPRFWALPEAPKSAHFEAPPEALKTGHFEGPFGPSKTTCFYNLIELRIITLITHILCIISIIIISTTTEHQISHSWDPFFRDPQEGHFGAPPRAQNKCHFRATRTLKHYYYASAHKMRLRNSSFYKSTRCL